MTAGSGILKNCGNQTPGEQSCIINDVCSAGNSVIQWQWVEGKVEVNLLPQQEGTLLNISLHMAKICLSAQLSCDSFL